MMPIAVEPSNRTGILYALIKEFVKDGMSFLDIGCGHVDFQGTRLPELIHEDFPNTSYLGLDVEEKVIQHNKESYPYYDWLLQDASKFAVDKQPDFVFHIGINKWWDESWKLHCSLYPKYVLLETGAPIEVGRSIHQEVLKRLKEIYLDRSYKIVQEGNYIWTAKVTQQLRNFVILKGGRP